MDPESVAPEEEYLAGLLARYDELLANGAGMPDAGREPAPDALRERLEEDLACLQVLHGLRPQSESAISAPAPPSVQSTHGSPLRYEVVRLHATGGIGRVWLARDDALGRCVALKDLRPEKAQQAAMRWRFLREAQITGQLQHPGIVPVYEVVTATASRERQRPESTTANRERQRPESREAPEPFYTMRFIQGRTLTMAAHAYHQKRAKGTARALDLIALLNAFISACNTVAYAHSRGVIHRDLKGDNVVLGDFGEVVVLDWGLAKVIGNDDEPADQEREHEPGPVVLEPEAEAEFHFSLLGQIIGTPSYMAPEQAEGRPDQVDERTDVYGLGAILYEILTGRPPFVGPDTAEVLRKARTEPPPRPSALWKRVPRTLEAVCLRALARAPAARYASVGELAREVQNWLADEPVRAYREPPAARLRRWSRHHRPLGAGAAALLATALIAAVVGAFILGEERARTAEVRAQASRAQVAAAARARAQLETHAYFQRIALAEREVTAGNISRAIQYLGDCPDNCRGWEWHCLQRLCRANQATLRGHAGAVAAIAFSSDGRHLVSAGHDGAVRFWDPRTGAPRRTVTGHGDAVYALAFSADSSRLASASWDKTVKLWDTATGKPVRTFGPHGSDLYRVAFSPDGRYIAAATAENTLHIWNADTGEEHLRLSERRCFFGLAFSPSEPGIVATSHDTGIKLWNYLSGEERARFDGHNNLIKTLAFSPDGSRLVSGDGDLLRGEEREIRLWDVATGREIYAFRGHTDAIYSLAFAPNGAYLASASQDKTIKLWDLDRGQDALTLRGHGDTVRAVAFSPDGCRLASASADGTVKLWDATPWKPEETSPVVHTLGKHSDRAIGAVFSPDGRLLASGGEESTAIIWDAETGAELRSLPVAAELFSLTFYRDGKSLATGNTDGMVRILDVETGNELANLGDARLGPIKHVVFSPDGRQLAAAGWWRTIQLWNVEGWTRSFTLAGHAQPVLRVAFRPDGRQLASASYDQTVMVWDAPSGVRLKTLVDHRSRVLSVAFSPDGATLASASLDGTVKLWNTATWQAARTLQANASGINAVAFSPDGRHLASAGDDWVVRIWELGNGRELRTLRGHSDRVHSVAFSPDGRRLVSSSYDRSVKLWDVAFNEPGREH